MVGMMMWIDLLGWLVWVGFWNGLHWSMHGWWKGMETWHGIYEMRGMESETWWEIRCFTGMRGCMIHDALCI